MGYKGEDINITIIYLTLGFLLFALFIILFIAVYRLRLNRHLKDKIQMQTQFNQALLQTQIEIQEQTLKNISEEIHDNIGQVLSLAKLNLNTFPENTGEEVKQRLADTELLVSKAIEDLRDLSQSMHGDKIASIGLETALERELKLIQNTGKFATNFQVAGESYSAGPQQEMVLFRIVQESLNNAVKHSHAKNIQISLQYNSSVLILQVKDDGDGFEADKLLESATGIGLKSMQNRATLIRASFVVHSSIGKGTAITIELKANKETAT